MQSSPRWFTTQQAYNEIKAAKLFLKHMPMKMSFSEKTSQIILEVIQCSGQV